MSALPIIMTERDDHLDPICPCANLSPDGLDTLLSSICHIDAGDIIDTFFVYIEGTLWTWTGPRMSYMCDVEKHMYENT